MTADASDRSFGAPRFDVVLRGYDRRQVDEHLSRLNRVLARMRGELEAARTQPPAPLMGPVTPTGGRPRPTPRPRPDGLPLTEGHDVVGNFTDRMQTILQSAEEEAAEIRAKARSAGRAEEERAAAARTAARSEEEAARAAVANLVRQRDAVLADLTRMRGQLEALLSGPTARIAVPAQDRPTPDGGPAAARRDPGAGQPLPGTASATGSAAPAGGTAIMRPATPATPPGDTTRTAPPAAARPKPDQQRPATRPGQAPDAGGARPPSGDGGADDGPDTVPAGADAPSAPRVEQTVATGRPATPEPPPSPAEQTAVMDPADAPDGAVGTSAPKPAEATVKVQSVGNRPAGGEPTAKPGARGNPDAEPASASRPG
jgi:syndecan 1